MVKKNFSITTDTWDQMMRIKKKLNDASGKIVPWDIAFQHMIKKFQTNSSSKSPNVPKSPALPKTPKTPALPKTPNIPGLPKIPKSPGLPKMSKGPSSPKMPPSKKGPRRPVNKPIPTDSDDLGIPIVPIKDPIILNASKDLIKKASTKDTDETKYILIECQICGETPIIMPVPRKLVTEADVPVVDITYHHGDPEHVVVAQLDPDFQVRRRRASWIVHQSDYDV